MLVLYTKTGGVWDEEKMYRGRADSLKVAQMYARSPTFSLHPHNSMAYPISFFPIFL